MSLQVRTANRFDALVGYEGSGKSKKKHKSHEAVSAVAAQKIQAPAEQQPRSIQGGQFPPLQQRHIAPVQPFQLGFLCKLLIVAFGVLLIATSSVHSDSKPKIIPDANTISEDDIRRTIVKADDVEDAILKLGVDLPELNSSAFSKWDYPAVDPRPMNAPVMKGVDKYGRPAVAFKYTLESEDHKWTQIGLIFRRYSSWKGNWAAWNAPFTATGGLTKETLKDLWLLFAGKVNEMQGWYKSFRLSNKTVNDPSYFEKIPSEWKP